MADLYASIDAVTPEIQQRLAEVLENRASDPRQRQMLESYLARIAFPPEARVLEIGCGTGCVSRTLACWPGVAEVVGIDPSAIFIARARELAAGIARLAFETGDGCRLRQAGGSFDLVVLQHGLPVFCVTIGIEYKGEIVAGVVYDPNLDELFTAEKGSGAFLNGRRMKVTTASRLIDSLLVTGFPYDIAENPDNAIGHFVNFVVEGQGLRRLGSAALDLSYVAAGRFDGFWEVSLNPWDMAAGVLFVREAGGRVTDFVGTESTIYTKQVLASNGVIHDAMLEILRKGFTR